MTEFEQIMKKMREQGIVPRIHYELMALRALKVAAVVMIGAWIVWILVK